jgi:hypothetical protein
MSKAKRGEPKLTQQVYQQLSGVMRGTWQSLAVVPASPSLSATPIAEALIEVARLARGTSARLFLTEGLEKVGVSKLIVEMSQHVDSGGVAVVSVESVVASQLGVPIAMAADAALLVVHLGVTTTEDAESSVSIVGKSKFLGAITIESTG